ncbi:MAG: lamin tail domain-containing protein [candidate division WOR-3 bacterium]
MTGILLAAVLSASPVVITEVMANPRGGTGAHGPEDRNEFVEICNISGRAVDLLDWTLDDGDSRDRLVPWADSSILAAGESLVIGTTWLLPGQYAVILDSEYTDTSPVGGYVQPYSFGSGCLILTVGNTTIGNGLAGNDPLIIASPYGDTTTFGTPFDTTDKLPRDAGDGFSWERIDLSQPDMADNWAVCPGSSGCTPGKPNAVACYQDLAITGMELLDSVARRAYEPVNVTVRVENVGRVRCGNWSLTVWVDHNSNCRTDPKETVAEFAGLPLDPGGDTVLVVTFGCPAALTDIWARLFSVEDRDTTNNRLRLSVGPGSGRELLNLPLAGFSPNGDGFEDSLPLLLHLPVPRGKLRVEVFDLAGRNVATLAREGFRPDNEDVRLYWDGRRYDGERLPAAIYAVWVRYEYAGQAVSAKRGVILRR